MNTVRFTQVVEKSGKPEVYLLLSETDKTFHDALEANRIMSLVGGVDGAKTEYGLVGYDKKRRGQLLLFPRSLRRFADSRVVGIKFNLFAEAAESKFPTTPRPHNPNAKKQPPETKKIEKAAKEIIKYPDPAKLKKVIPFPREDDEADEADEEQTQEQLKALARQALRALEKNNSVAAYKILQEMIEG
jgi:hypothetical protein